MDEAATLTIAGQPVSVAGDNSFDAMVNVSEDTNIVAVTATDYSENISSKNYRVIVLGAGRGHPNPPNKTRDWISDHGWTPPPR